MTAPGSRPTTAIVIPTKDGMPLLEEVLRGAAAQHADEFLVVDSGSTDGSVAAARAAGARVLEIPPAEFGHGRTRNLAVRETTAEIVAFLTQDATPVEGWLDAYVDAFAQDERIGSAFGPHHPRASTSPMIARELVDFFGPFSPDGRVTIHRRPTDPTWHPEFLSNANAAYRRTALEEIPFRDIGYAEDQAFARDSMAAGWRKAYQPAAGALHAHDYPWLTFVRRYFDEYRGLQDSVGYRMSFYPRGLVRDILVESRADVQWVREMGGGPGSQRRWAARALRHHTGRRVAGLAGGRAHKMPARVRRTLSLEGRDAIAAAPEPLPPLPWEIPSQAIDTRTTAASPYGAPYAIVTEVEREGVVPLDASRTADPDGPLEVAVIVPAFRPGSGGHSTIFTLIEQLERKGHTCSIWLHDPSGMHLRQTAAEIEADIHRHFRRLQASVHVGLGDWRGADVTLATGWDTVYVALRLPRTGARAYLVQDHEPEFFATSAERLWADRTYTYGLHPICASRWLAQLLQERHGTDATHFDLGVDHDVYRPEPSIERRTDTVALYTRPSTPRRAGPLAIMALHELLRRRDDVRVVTFGGDYGVALPFPFQFAGIRSPAELARLYAEATVGLVPSLTNYSLVPQEMLACGLPCVDVTGASSEVAYGPDSPVDLAEPTAPALADALERLLDDRDHWAARSKNGVAFVADKTWTAAGDRLEEGLRVAARGRTGDA